MTNTLTAETYKAYVLPMLSLYYQSKDCDQMASHKNMSALKKKGKGQGRNLTIDQMHVNMSFRITRLLQWMKVL